MLLQRKIEHPTNHCSRTMRTPTMICTVCRDAGKPSSQYTSHYVKDRPGGRVVCPYLLSLVCRYCKKAGHTLSHCPAFQTSGQNVHPNRPRPLRPPPKSSVRPAAAITVSDAPPVKNAFQELAESSDEDAELPTPQSFDWHTEPPE